MSKRPDVRVLPPGWVLVAAVAIIVSLPVLIFGVPFGLDLPHHYRLASGFYESASGGNFYPSWLASTNDGYGDPSVRFYPPALYFLLSASRLIGGDWYAATLITWFLAVSNG